MIETILEQILNELRQIKELINPCKECGYCNKFYPFHDALTDTYKTTINDTMFWKCKKYGDSTKHK